MSNSSYLVSIRIIIVHGRKNKQKNKCFFFFATFLLTLCSILNPITDTDDVIDMEFRTIHILDK